MASHIVIQVAPEPAREGFDTRNKDLNGACTEKQERVDRCFECGVPAFADGNDRCFCEDCEVSCELCGGYWDGDTLPGLGDARVKVCMGCLDDHCRAIDGLEFRDEAQRFDDPEKDSEEEDEVEYDDGYDNYDARYYSF